MTMEKDRKSLESAVEAEVAKNPESTGVVSRGLGYGQFSQEELLSLCQRYPLLANASQGKLDELNKTVLRKLDWRFLPCITLMLLMA